MVALSEERIRKSGVGEFVFLEMILQDLSIIREGHWSIMSCGVISRSTSRTTTEKV